MKRIKKVLIYLCYYASFIVPNLFWGTFILVTVVCIVYKKQIAGGILGFIFFFFFGLYAGFRLYKASDRFLNEEYQKEDSYLHELMKKRENKINEKD